MLGFHVCIAAGFVGGCLGTQGLEDEHHMPYEGSE